MTETSSPKITFMLQYTKANTGYVDYMNRQEAVSLENEMDLTLDKKTVEDLTKEQIEAIQEAVPEQQLHFREYIDYMNRSYATEKQDGNVTAVFNQDANYLQRDKLKDLKEKLKMAYDNKSMLWQGVISFDNAFLAEQGLYDKETGQVDQQAIKTIVRDAMPKVIEKEGLSDSAFWWGNIHLNTDNIHVHFGLSEVESTREKIFYQPRGQMEYKGNFSQKTIQKFKSDIYNGLINQETRALTLRREQILSNLKSDLLKNVFVQEHVSSSAEKKFLEQAYSHLPHKKVSYKSHAKDFAVSKFFLDKYIDSYLLNDGKEEYQRYLTESRTFLEGYRSAYKKTGSTESLLEKRMLELRERLGNKILKEFREGAPHFSSHQLQKNLDHFSRKNQELILEQCPDATVIKEMKDWKRLGYKVSEALKPIMLYKPTYASYDKYGNGIGEATYILKPYYDMSQVYNDIANRQLTLKDLSILDTKDLKRLVDASATKEDPSQKEVKELGTYRHALKLRMVEENRAVLLVTQQLLNQVTPLKSDEPFLTYKQLEIKERLTLSELQLRPNYQLSASDINLKSELTSKYPDPVQLPISKAENIDKPLAPLLQEIALLDQLQDKSILTFIKGRETTKDDYVSELKAKVKVLQLKKEIHTTNKTIASFADDDSSKPFKQMNASYFKELKNLYQEINPVDDDKQNQILKQVTQEMASQRSQKQVVQAEKPSVTVSSDFMKGLSTALKGAGRSNKKAIEERIRSDERAEQEERSRSL